MRCTGYWLPAWLKREWRSLRAASGRGDSGKMGDVQAGGEDGGEGRGGGDCVFRRSALHIPAYLRSYINGYRVGPIVSVVCRAAPVISCLTPPAFERMGIDDSKYLLQLARADVLTLPESPGDWNSVTVKSPKEGIKPRPFHPSRELFNLMPSPTHTYTDGSTPAQDPSNRATMSPNTTQHPSSANPAGSPTPPQTTQHSIATAQNTSSPQTRQNYQVCTPSDARRQLTGPNSPPPYKGRGLYRMNLVSTIQPSFGTYPSEPSPKDEPMKDNPASEADK